jgi:hypothetical protein
MEPQLDHVGPKDASPRRLPPGLSSWGTNIQTSEGAIDPHPKSLGIKRRPSAHAGPAFGFGIHQKMQRFSWSGKHQQTDAGLPNSREMTESRVACHCSPVANGNHFAGDCSMRHALRLECPHVVQRGWTSFGLRRT